MCLFLAIFQSVYKNNKWAPPFAHVGHVFLQPARGGSVHHMIHGAVVDAERQHKVNRQAKDCPHQQPTPVITTAVTVIFMIPRFQLTPVITTAVTVIFMIPLFQPTPVVTTAVTVPFMTPLFQLTPVITTAVTVPFMTPFSNDPCNHYCSDSPIHDPTLPTDPCNHYSVLQWQSHSWSHSSNWPL